MKKLYTITFALIVLLSMTMSAVALEYKTISRSDGMAADASWTETNDDVTTDIWLSLNEDDDGTNIYLSINIWGPDSWCYMSGYLYTQDKVFSMKNNLNSASLSDVQIDVYGWGVDETGEYIEVTETLTVSADWTGTGDIIESSYTSISKYDDYISKVLQISSYRSAIATGWINGNDLGSSSYATLSEFKSAYMDMEK